MTIAVDRVDTRPGAEAQTYQTFFDVRSDGELVKRVEEQLEAWLREKGWDPPTEESGYHVDPTGRELLVLHRRSNDGRDFRARLREQSPVGVWTTTLTVHDSRNDSSWIGLHVANSEGRFVAVPRLAGYLMDALEVRDGEIWMSTKPRLVHVSGVEAFAEELSCPDRQGLYFVASPADDGQTLPSYLQQVQEWTRQTIGLAQVAVLDSAAAEAFNAIMGPHHSTSPGTIRTYRPEVDPAIMSDGRRHRIFGASRLGAEPVGAVKATLGRAARRHAAERARPRRFTPVDQALTRLEDRLLLDALTVERPEPVPAPRTPPEPVIGDEAMVVGDEAATYLAQIELVKECLGIPEVSAETLDDVAQSLSHARAGTDALSRLTREMESRRLRIDELEEKVEFFQGLDDDHELALAEAEGVLANAADENRWLRARLRELQDFESAAAVLPATEATEYPSDFAELADWVVDGRRLPSVVFTGDIKQVRDLEDHDQVGRIAQTAWDALLALADYVRAREADQCDGNVKHYLCNTPSGYRTVPPKKFAEKETGATMRAWGDQRAFPVPETVDPEGMSVMEAHFKLGRVGMISPRLYYLDDWSKSGRVYVGYIGSHLRNTQTN